jgi:hypothetical protein
VDRIGRWIATGLALFAACLVILAFLWGGWAGEAALMLAVALLIAGGIIALLCRIHRTTEARRREVLGPFSER